MNRITGFFSLLFAVLFLSACFTTSPTSTGNTSTSRPKSQALYNPFIYRMHPEFFIYEQNVQKTVLYTKIYLSEIKFIPIGAQKRYQGKIRIEYKIYSDINSQQVLDSASANFNVRKQKNQNNIISYIQIEDNNRDKYFLEVTTTDVFRRSSVTKYISVDKTNINSAQKYLIVSKKNNQIYFKNFFRPEHYFSIQHNTAVDSIYIKYYQKEIPMPYPPYSDMKREKINTEPDSVWSVSGREAFQFHEEKTGFYFLQIDTTQAGGLSLLNPGPYFPYVKTSLDMVKPLQYLCSEEEFQELRNSSNKKLAVDRFWLECTGDNTARARELIRIYYNRTLYANVYFTSFTQGWRTDRGMIYLMFGPPKTVKNFPDKEIWLYHDRLNFKVLQFVFKKVENSYTDNDYILERHIDFRSFWFQAVKSWRNGKVYSVFQ